MENKHHGSSSSSSNNQRAENNSPVDEQHQEYRKLMSQFDQLIAGEINVGHQDLLLGEMSRTTPALAPMVIDDQMQIDDQMMQPNNLVETQLQLPDFDFDFQNYQLPNETEEEMVDRLLAHVEHMSRDFDRIHDEFQRQCAEFEAEFERLGNLFDGLGGGSTAEFEVDMGDGEDAIASQQANVAEVGAEGEEPMEEEVVISSGLAEEEILENLNGADFQVEHQREDICCICLGAYEGGEEKRKMGCGHMFHYECIRRWLLRKNSCPLCSRVVFNLH